MSDIDLFYHVPKNGNVAINEDGLSASDNNAKRLDEEAKIRTIELLKREDVITTSDIISRFQNHDKEAAEILVRTFYPYVESLLIALEKNEFQKRTSERIGVAPALTSIGSHRSEFLNEFFIDFVNNADKIDLSKGVRLYLYKTCAEAFREHTQEQSAVSSASDFVQNTRKSESLFFDDDIDSDAAEESRRQLYENSDGATTSVFFDDNATRLSMRKKISGTPVWRYTNSDLPEIKRQESTGISGGGRLLRTAADRDKNVYTQSKYALSKQASDSEADILKSKSGTVGGARLLRSDSSKLSLASRIYLRNGAHLAPPLSNADESIETKENDHSSTSVQSSSQKTAISSTELSHRANSIVRGLKKLAVSDIEAYRAVTMRYFANCSFAELCHKLEVTSASELGLRLLRGLLSINTD